MNRNTPLLAFAAVAAIGLFAAACGSSGSSGLYGSAPTASPTTAAPAAAKVGVGTTGLGHVVVNSAGRTVYLFAKDTKGQSMCSGRVRDLLAARDQHRQAGRPEGREPVTGRHDQAG